VAASVLSRYLNPDVLAKIAQRPIEPRGLVFGNLAGAHKSPLCGFAVEFASHREYVPGDDPKHIDWRVYFTREKYFIKQYEMETNFVCHLILDVSASMRYGEGTQQKLLYAAQMATTLGYAIVQQSDKVSLATFDNKVLDYLQPSNSMAQVVRITSHLDTIKPVEKTRMTECLVELTGRMKRREIVMVFSDFLTDLDTLEPALQRMRNNGHEVILFQVLHHHEREFDFEGMHKFVALEEGDFIIGQSEDLRRDYLRALKAYSERFQEICHNNRVELVAVDTSHDLGEVFINYLNERSLLKQAR
jgi:uncharacterized protein (DUF58 family)